MFKSKIEIEYNVLHIVDIASPVPGTLFDTLKSVNSELRKNGAKMLAVFPCYRPWHNDLTKSNVQIYLLRIPSLKQFFAFIFFIRNIYKIIKEENIRIVHCHFGSTDRLCGIFLKFFIKKLKIVWHWRNPPASMVQKTNWFKKVFRNQFYSLMSLGVDGHIAISNEVKSWLDQVAHQKVYFIPNAVSLERFSHVSDSVQLNYRMEFNIVPDNFVFCSIANFRPEKDHKTLIKAIKIVTHEYPHVRLLFVGFGPLLGNAIEYAQEMGVDNNIYFTNERKDVECILAISDAFVLSTFFEGFGNVICEAMALNKPVIATNVGGCRDIITKDVGFLVDRENAQVMAEKMIWMIENRQLALEMGMNGRKRVESQYSLDICAGRIIGLYEKLVQDST